MLHTQFMYGCYKTQCHTANSQRSLVISMWLQHGEFMTVGLCPRIYDGNFFDAMDTLLSPLYIL